MQVNYIMLRDIDYVVNVDGLLDVSWKVVTL